MTKFLTLDEYKTPVLVAVGQYTQRAEDPSAGTPLEMLRRAVERLAEDAGVGAVALSGLDAIAVVKSFKNTYRNPAQLLARELGATNARCIHTVTGGHNPQALVNHYARCIAAGDSSLVLLTGAELLATNARLKKQGIRPDWPDGSSGEAEQSGSERPGTNALEDLYGLTYPRNTYPLFENALRAHYGSDVPTHQRQVAELFSGFSRVAAQNPHAWLPVWQSADKLAAASPQNRMICFPYTKRLSAMPLVDQSAALLLTSVGRARELGIDEEQWVYLQGGADADEHWHVSERERLYESPAIRAIGAEALRQSGLGIDQVAYFDLYSCFPSAVQITRDMLGIPKHDPRPLTVTGGLPYFGGPGNNYSMHGIAAMVEKLRGDPGAFGLVTANGWYLTRHSIGIYGTRPWGAPPVATVSVTGNAIPCIAEAEGEAVIESYSIPYSREGAPERAIIVGRLTGSGQRFLAWSTCCGEELRCAEMRELVGLKGKVSHREKCNWFSFY